MDFVLDLEKEGKKIQRINIGGGLSSSYSDAEEPEAFSYLKYRQQLEAKVPELFSGMSWHCNSKSLLLKSDFSQKESTKLSRNSVDPYSWKPAQHWPRSNMWKGGCQISSQSCTLTSDLTSSTPRFTNRKWGSTGSTWRTKPETCGKPDPDQNPSSTMSPDRSVSRFEIKIICNYFHNKNVWLFSGRFSG